MKLAPYWKTVVAAIVAVAVAVANLISDDTLTTAELVEVALVLLGAVGVYAAPNQPKETVSPGR